MNPPEYYITRNADRIDIENMRKWDNKRLAEEYLNLTKHTMIGIFGPAATNHRNMIAGILVLERNIESILLLPGFDPIVIKQYEYTPTPYRPYVMKP